VTATDKAAGLQVVKEIQSGVRKPND